MLSCLEHPHILYHRDNASPSCTVGTHFIWKTMKCEEEFIESCLVQILHSRLYDSNHAKKKEYTTICILCWAKCIQSVFKTVTTSSGSTSQALTALRMTFSKKHRNPLLTHIYFVDDKLRSDGIYLTNNHVTSILCPWCLRWLK